MVKYRGRLEIIADILNAAEKEGKKTRIMYIANLSYSLLEKYLTEVLGMGFVNVINNNYELTEKGRIFLEKFGQFSSRYSKLTEELKAMRFERELLERMCVPTNSFDRRTTRTELLKTNRKVKNS